VEEGYLRWDNLTHGMGKDLNVENSTLILFEVTVTNKPLIVLKNNNNYTNDININRDLKTTIEPHLVEHVDEIKLKADAERKTEKELKKNKKKAQSNISSASESAENSGESHSAESGSNESASQENSGGKQVTKTTQKSKPSKITETTSATFVTTTIYTDLEIITGTGAATAREDIAIQSSSTPLSVSHLDTDKETSSNKKEIDVATILTVTQKTSTFPVTSATVDSKSIGTENSMDTFTSTPFTFAHLDEIDLNKSLTQKSEVTVDETLGTTKRSSTNYISQEISSSIDTTQPTNINTHQITEKSNTKIETRTSPIEYSIENFSSTDSDSTISSEGWSTLTSQNIKTSLETTEVTKAEESLTKQESTETSEDELNHLNLRFPPYGHLNISSRELGTILHYILRSKSYGNDINNDLENNPSESDKLVGTQQFDSEKGEPNWFAPKNIFPQNFLNVLCSVRFTRFAHFQFFFEISIFQESLQDFQCKNYR
jgi:hypothetical protein